MMKYRNTDHERPQNLRQHMPELPASSDNMFNATSGLGAYCCHSSENRVQGAIPPVHIEASASVIPPAPMAYNELPVFIAPGDQEKCTDCKTCYRALPMIFERTQIIINGKCREVGHLIPDVFSHVELTPALLKRIKRVAACCDAEIVHVRG